MTGTVRLQLPLIEPGQAQKELFHNEALLLLDAAVQASVEAVGLEAPPTAPEPGQSWIIGGAPIGGWSGRADALTSWTQGGWRFVQPVEGMAVWDAGEQAVARFIAGRWEKGVLRGQSVVLQGQRVVGPRGPAIADPGGGTVVDEPARAAVLAILATLRRHGLIEG